MKKRKLLSLLLILSLILGIAGCGKSSESNKGISATGEDESETHSYNIAVCLEEDNTINSYYAAGFKKAMADKLGSDNLTFYDFAADKYAYTAKDIAIDVTSGYNVVFTVGENMLAEAQKAIKIAPIVACGVYDFEGILELEGGPEQKTWNGVTGRNVTGVSAVAPMGDQLSVMIESCEYIYQMALIRRADDTGSAYQHELLKEYLRTAGIRYRELFIEEDTDVAELLKKACDTCDVIYLAAGNNLASDKKTMTLIRDKAVATGTATYGGDTVLANYTTVTLFNDPYEQGYKAGLKAVKILQGSDIHKMKITKSSSKNCTKLYNDEIAKATFTAFPKSFKELHTFLADYTIPVLDEAEEEEQVE